MTSRGAVGLSDFSIEIVAHRASWPEEFSAVAARLRAGFGARALRIDHVGSTSVRGLAAKDVIDVQVTVSALEPEEPLRTAIEASGFDWRSDVDRDHVPPGSNGVWAKRYAREVNGRRTHVHIRAEGTPNQRYALLFRDFLRAHRDAAEAYARLKLALAALTRGNRDAYTDTKDHACDLVMLAAEPWAAATAWHPGSPDA